MRKSNENQPFSPTPKLPEINKSNPKAKGSVSINAHDIPFSDIKIAPTGSGEYAVSIEQFLDNQPDLYLNTHDKSIDITYFHSAFPEPFKFHATLLDFGLSEESNKLATFTLFFKASLIENQPKIQLIKPRIIT